METSKLGIFCSLWAHQQWENELDNSNRYVYVYIYIYMHVCVYTHFIVYIYPHMLTIICEVISLFLFEIRM